MRQKAFLLVIDGPSAVGKSTIVRALLALPDVGFELSKRITTRPKRDSDEDEDLYEFVTHEDFKQLADRGAFIEHKCYKFGMCYGLPKKEVLGKLAVGNHVLAMINLGNIQEVRALVQNTYGVFVSASLQTIRERLVHRKTHPREQIEERLDNASTSLQHAKLYDLVVMNENRSIDDVVQEIEENFLLRVKAAATDNQASGQ